MSMPKRPAEHQIEDISVNAFKQSMPNNWVVREKSHDYGIDLEVEIFDDQGRATGAIFFVQLKATSSKEIKAQESVQFPIGHLHYYAALDAPVLLARYSVKRKCFFYKWSHEIAFKHFKPSQKSTKIKFTPTNHWEDYTCEGICSTVFAIRNMRNLTPKSTLRMMIEFDVNDQNANISRVKRMIRTNLPENPIFLIVDDESTDDIYITIKIFDEKIFLSLKGLLPTTIPFDFNDEENIGSSFLYAFCTFLTRAQLNNHASVIASHISEGKLISPDRQLAFRAASALHGDLRKMLDVALQNNLHTVLDEWSISFIMHLVCSGGRSDAKTAAINEFNNAAILAFTEINAPNDVIAPLYYNIGNAHRSAGNHALALAAYNKARKLDNTYMDRTYFILEIGSVMFLSGKYSCAAVAYKELVRLDSCEHNYFLYADALFFSGDLKLALEYFAKIELSAFSPLSVETKLKTDLASAIIDDLKRDTFVRRTSEANALMKDIKDFSSKKTKNVFDEVLKTVDPLHPLAAYNLGVSMMKSIEITCPAPL